MRKVTISSGAVFEKLRIVAKTPSEITRTVDSVDRKEIVQWAFISDENSKSSLKTATEWASRSFGHANSDSEMISTENPPRSGYRIFDLEFRGEGGRAYKVITPDGYYVDMREDVLMDVILNAGITKGGEMLCEFVWGRIGNQTRIVRVGSKMHEGMTGASNRSKMKKISSKDLEVGGVYRTASGKIGMFLGRVDSVKKNQFLFYELYKFQNEEDVKNIPKELSQLAKDSFYRFEISSSISYVEKISLIEGIDSAKIIEAIRNDSVKSCRERIKSHVNYAASNPSFYTNSWYNRQRSLASDISTDINYYIKTMKIKITGSSDVEIPDDIKAHMTATTV